jgi:hypothetical protein
MTSTQRHNFRANGRYLAAQICRRWRMKSRPILSSRGLVFERKASKHACSHAGVGSSRASIPTKPRLEPRGIEVAGRAKFGYLENNRETLYFSALRSTAWQLQ